jgi:hypothetical protein
MYMFSLIKPYTFGGIQTRILSSTGRCDEGQVVPMYVGM